MMNNEQRMKVERHRVSEMFAKQVQDISVDAGDIRFFASAALVAAVQLCAEVEGNAATARQLCRLAAAFEATFSDKH